MTAETLAVLQDFNGHIFIQVSIGYKHVRAISQSCHGVALCRFPKEELRYMNVLDYPVKKAAARMEEYSHAVGITDAAAEVLRAIV